MNFAPIPLIPSKILPIEPITPEIVIVAVPVPAEPIAQPSSVSEIPSLSSSKSQTSAIPSLSVSVFPEEIGSQGFSIPKSLLQSICPTAVKEAVSILSVVSV